MSFELRALKASDLYKVAGILGKIGVSELSEPLSKLSEEDADPMVAGMEVAGVVLANVEKVETDLNKWLGDLAGIPPKKVADLSPVQFVDLIESVVQLDDFSEFFGRVSQFVK